MFINVIDPLHWLTPTRSGRIVRVVVIGWTIFVGHWKCWRKCNRHAPGPLTDSMLRRGFHPQISSLAYTWSEFMCLILHDITSTIVQTSYWPAEIPSITCLLFMCLVLSCMSLSEVVFHLLQVLTGRYRWAWLSTLCRAVRKVWSSFGMRFSRISYDTNEIAF